MSDETGKLYCPRCLTTFDDGGEICPNLSCRRAKPTDGWGRIFEPGEVFDRNYRLHDMLAIGGAGVTYVARELGPDGEETGPELAIKVLLTARDQGPYLRRLATEAQIIQELDHPNIVQYLGFVHRAGHSPYLITHYEAGGSLLDQMRRAGVLTVREATQVARQICWALEKAHEKGIVHRDLKPENVLLTRKFEPGEALVIKVADFGIAKVHGSLGSNLTRVGAFVGTPHYAAPEQFVGGAVTRAADVFAVGALVNFCITARHVVQFADRLDPEDSFQLLRDSLPPWLELPHEPAEDVRRINQVLAVAMAVEPKDRCTVVELDEMLSALLAGHDPSPPEARPDLPDARSFPPSASVVGIAGAAAALGDVASVQTRAHLAPRVETGPAPTAADVEPQPTRSLDPDEISRVTGPAPKKRGWIVALLGLGGLGFLALVAVAAALYLLPGPWHDEVVKDALPIELTGKETDMASRMDYRAVRASLDGLHDWVSGQCKVEPGTTVNLELVIEADGSVRSARALSGEDGACVAKAVKRATFSRTGAYALRVRLPLTW